MKKNPYRIINRAIKEHLESGAKLTPRWNIRRSNNGKQFELGTVEGSPCGCPLAMVIDGKKCNDEFAVTATACKTLSLSKDWVWSFIEGFDDSPVGTLSDESIKAAYNFGKRLRDKHEALGNVI